MFEWIRSGAIKVKGELIIPSVGDDVTAIIKALPEGVVASLISDGFIRKLTKAEIKKAEEKLAQEKVLLNKLEKAEKAKGGK